MVTLMGVGAPLSLCALGPAAWESGPASTLYHLILSFPTFPLFSHVRRHPGRSVSLRLWSYHRYRPRLWRRCVAHCPHLRGIRPSTRHLASRLGRQRSHRLPHEDSHRERVGINSLMLISIVIKHFKFSTRSNLYFVVCGQLLFHDHRRARNRA